MTDKETWRAIAEYEGLYEISSLGRVRRIANGGGAVPGRILRSGVTKAGYHVVVLYKHGSKKTCNVHSLVACAFLGPKPFCGAVVAHNDGCGTNNAENNLRWDSQSGNLSDRVRHGTDQNGHRNHNAKLSPGQVEEIRKADLSKRGAASKLAGRLSVSCVTISQIRSNARWKGIQ